MKPIIGITSNVSYVSEQPETDIDTIYSPAEYADAITKAGGLPVTIPFQKYAEAKDYINQIDGLILTGGADISPHLYSEDPHLKLGATDTARDEWEIALLEEAYQKKIPVLGICRGLQLMNVYSGGNLYQDLPSQKENVIQHIQKTNFHETAHQIQLKKDSFLEELYGEQLFVNTYHHQAIKELADDLEAIAWANDQVIEAVAFKNSNQKAFGVQWHPELLAQDYGSGQLLFNYFINLCQ